ncbi:hypothetical protein MHA01_00640 [Marinococcus halophilus]|uniref:Uncharacterized protein n=1 Tax=Marinococcus halophilus TaxID=1371 RepID=A0A510Y1K2_MARHA|nr:hypothetical protein MHA01_00640 [Marinococcus halophilus]
MDCTFFHRAKWELAYARSIIKAMPSNENMQEYQELKKELRKKYGRAIVK